MEYSVVLQALPEGKFIAACPYIREAEAKGASYALNCEKSVVTKYPMNERYMLHSLSSCHVCRMSERWSEFKDALTGIIKPDR